MTEQQLLTLILEAAENMDLLAFHSGDSRRDAGSPGFPDVVLAGPGGVLFAELKSDGGETSAEQDAWAHCLWRRQLYRLWRPDDWWNGTVERELQQLAG